MQVRTLKDIVLISTDSLIENEQDCINGFLGQETVLTNSDVEELKESQDRLVQLVRFRKAFELGIDSGPDRWDVKTLESVVIHAIAMEG